MTRQKGEKRLSSGEDSSVKERAGMSEDTAEE